MMRERDPETGLATPQRFSLPHGILALSSILSCIVVSVMGFFLVALMWQSGIPGPGWATGIGNEESVLSGVAFAGEVAAYGFFLIFISGPLAWVVLSRIESRLRSIGRVTFRARVLRSSRGVAILFAVLGAIVSMPYAIHTIAGATLTATALGAIGGAFGGGSLHHFLSRRKLPPNPDTFR